MVRSCYVSGGGVLTPNGKSSNGLYELQPQPSLSKQKQQMVTGQNNTRVRIPNSQTPLLDTATSQEVNDAISPNPPNGRDNSLEYQCKDMPAQM